MKKLISLLPNILNIQIFDKNGMQCGKVDDIEINPKTGKIKSLLVGANAWYGDGKEEGLIRHFILTKLSPQKDIVVIPINKVAEIFPNVKLTISQKELGIGSSEDTIGNWLRRIPGA